MLFEANNINCIVKRDQVIKSSGIAHGYDFTLKSVFKSESSNP